MTRGEQVLRWLKKFPKGKRFGELQRFIVEELQGRDWNEREGSSYYDHYLGHKVITSPTGGPRRYRGYGCTLLVGGSGSRQRVGVLRKFCAQVKDEHGIVRYVVVKPIKPPFSRYSNAEMKARDPDFKTQAEQVAEAKHRMYTMQYT